MRSCVRSGRIAGTAARPRAGRQDLAQLQSLIDPIHQMEPVPPVYRPFGDAARLIQSGEVDIALCGGVEASINRVSLGV
ncbi:hypothetical protein SAMN05216279_12839 [Pseudomonas oryzihabitans]|jgi:hypothetical protein|uniref:Uncharacterized protein n=1 Tax=Pseudomonas oryzihabitans TaxID=47885 RepID=A0A1G5PGJ0_9PSED|nr:hypothetical protein SAMN05216279_12839 [Pseudomonas psychrotolerans]